MNAYYTESVFTHGSIEHDHTVLVNTAGASGLLSCVFEDTMAVMKDRHARQEMARDGVRPHTTDINVTRCSGSEKRDNGGTRSKAES